MTSRPQEVVALREKLAIKVEGEPPGQHTFKPVRSFQEAGFPADVLSACRCARLRSLRHPSSCPLSLLLLRSTFKQPSPIQSQCWPIVLRGAPACVAAPQSHLT